MTDILAERQKTHGDFYDVARMAQELKDAMRRGKTWGSLDDIEREALQMIASKIGRIWLATRMSRITGKILRVTPP